ncbi:hypothetical protein DFH11DRAFT_1617433 [Phellopilus nigrolimitatus]|nr:hypothetical protein DFH11DRAFT_1617433 [Phellopilus nigrolimitatus]
MCEIGGFCIFRSKWFCFLCSLATSGSCHSLSEGSAKAQSKMLSPEIDLIWSSKSSRFCHRPSTGGPNGLRTWRIRIAVSLSARWSNRLFASSPLVSLG